VLIIANSPFEAPSIAARLAETGAGSEKNKVESMKRQLLRLLLQLCYDSATTGQSEMMF
jgi:hypothetical protein